MISAQIHSASTSLFGRGHLVLAAWCIMHHQSSPSFVPDHVWSCPTAAGGRTKSQLKPVEHILVRSVETHSGLASHLGQSCGTG